MTMLLRALASVSIGLISSAALAGGIATFNGDLKADKFVDQNADHA